MTGAILNVITVAIGSLFGLVIGNRFPENMQQSVMTALGLVTLVVALSNAGRSGNIIIPLISLVIGAVIGELLNIEGALERFGGWLRDRLIREKTALPNVVADALVSPHPQPLSLRERGDNQENFDANPSPNVGRNFTETPVEVSPLPQGEGSGVRAAFDDRARFINGFVTASLIFCIGPLTFVGSIQDGMGLAIGFQQIAIKSILDFFAAMAFASTLGVGVFFSTITIIIVQGGLSLAGMLLGDFMTAPMINEMTAVGGLILIGLSLILLDIKRPRVANYLPALIIAPAIVAIGGALGVNLYPL
jgi:hypothetical protein